SKPVTGVSTSNFNLVPTGGINGQFIVSIVPSASSTSDTWTVIVATGNGSGTLGLKPANSTRVSDATGNSVTPPTFTGQVYTIDKTPAALNAINALDQTTTGAQTVHYSVTFSKPVTGLSTSNFDFVITGGLTSPSVTSVKADVTMGLSA